MKDILERQLILKEAIKISRLDESYLISISGYLDFLLLKNEELNLLSRKLDLKSIIKDHILDCLIAQNFFKEYSSITDIGSGGGLPGILLSIIFPEKKITLIDKSPKKTIFLNETVNLLKLKNIEIINGLVNEFKIKSQVVTCRAFKSIIEIISMTKNFYLNGGIYILYKAKRNTIDEELKEAEKKYKFNVQINKIDSITDKERNILIIKK